MQEPQRPMFRLFQYLRNYNRPFVIATTNSIINKIFDLMPPFLTAWIIDTVSGHPPTWIGTWTGLEGPWPMVIFLAILTVVIFLGESFFEWLYLRGFLRMAQNVQHDIRMDAYQKLQTRELAFFEEQRTGNLMAILNDDINQLERFLNHSFKEIVHLVTLFIFAGWSLCAVSLPLGLIGMIPIPFIILVSIYYQRLISPNYRKVRNAVGHLGNRLENNISGILVIKSFTAEKFEYQRVQANSDQYRNANFSAIKWLALYEPVIRIFITIGFAATLLIGAYWVLFEPGRFSLGSLAFFAMMIQRLLWPVTRMGQLFDEFERAKASARRVFGLLDTPARIVDPAAPKALPEAAGNIKFDHVHFKYDQGSPVLNGLNFQVKTGETIGIAGQTGAGKTTLIKLLLRLYDVTDGKILLDGIDLRSCSIKDLRQKIALVSQDVYLFHGTISENIAYGIDHADQATIEAAAKKAELHDFITSLPDGYQSIVGERGIKLSGGQRQRLSIARAILKNAPIIILDEATSAVDTETERAIQSHLDELVAGKTALIIAHRLSTIRNADRIIVLKAGQLAEQGTHDELLEKAGIYADLWNVQVGGE